jgi:hypothetical protein
MADGGTSGSGMWGGLVQSVVGMVGSIYGASHAKKNQKQLDLLEKNRPWYSRPGEENQYLELAKNNAYSKMPGQSQAEQNIQQSSQSAMNNIQNMSDNPTSSLDAISDLYRKEIGAFNNLSTQQAQYYQGNQDRLAQALQASAKYKDQEWDYNVNMPWQRQYQSKLNEWQSNRNLMQQGVGTIAQGAGNMNWSGSNQRIQSNPSNINYNQMASDVKSGQNGSQMDYNAQDANSYGGNV